MQSIVPLVLLPLLLAAGALTFYQTWKITTDDAYLERYLVRNRKMQLWRFFFGDERAKWLLRWVFAPVGALAWLGLCAGLLLWGVWAALTG